MADQIGALGLDVGDFSNAVDGAISRLTSLATTAVTTTGNIAGLAAITAGALVTAVYQSKKAVEELNASFQEIKASTAFNDQLTSVGQMEGAIKKLNEEISKIDNESYFERVGRFVGSAHILGGEGFDKSEEDQEKARAARAAEIEALLSRIAKKEKDQLDVMVLQRDNQKEDAELLKNELEYKNKIAKANEAGNGQLAAVLAKEKEITEELIKQKYARERASVTSNIASDQAKAAIDTVLNDQKNQDALNDREADAQQKLIDDQREADRKQYQEHLVQIDNEGRAIKENMDAEYQRWLAEQDKKEERLKQLRGDQANQERIMREADAKEIERYNQEQKRKRLEAAREILQETIAMERARMGNQTEARRRKMEDDYIRRIEENADNPKAVAELKAQRDQARRDFGVEEMNKSSSQRRAERDADRKRQRDYDRLDKQNAELDRRIDSGVRGSEGSAIERRRLERANNTLNENRSRRAQNIGQFKGYSQADSKNIADIAAAFRAKSG